MNRRFFIIIGFLTLVIYLAAFRADARFLKIISSQGTHKLKVEIARTVEERQVGLMGRKELPNGTGMLFVYEEENPKPVIWTRWMLIPIDIVFIGEDLRINYIKSDVEPCTARFDRGCNRYGSPIESIYVLELPGGFTMRYGIDQGDQIILPLGIQ